MKTSSSKIAISLLVSGAVPAAGDLLAHVYLPDYLHQLWPNEPLHAALESVGAISALILAGMLMMKAKREEEAPPHCWTSCGLIAMGVLDLFHACVHPGVCFVWLHSMSTLIGGFLFALIWLPNRFCPRRLTKVLPGVVAVAVSAFAVLSLAFPSALPVMVVDAQFTGTARALNILGGLLFLAAAARFAFRYRTAGRTEDLLFVNLCVLFGTAGLLFELSHLWGLDWWFWHLLRLVAYVLVLGYVSVIYRRMEEALRQSEEFNRRLVEHAPLGVLYLGADGTIEYSNPASNRILGVPEDQASPAIGAKIFDLPGLQQQPDALELFRGLLQGNPFVDAEIPYRSLTGKDVVNLTAGSPRVLPDGSVAGAVVMYTDIADRKRAEEALQESEEKTRQLSDVAFEGIVFHEGGVVLHANRQYYDMLGYDPDDLVGKQALLMTLTPESLETVRKHIESGSTAPYEAVGMRKDGSRFPIEIQARSREFMGRTVRAAAIRDISEHKAMEIRLREAQKMEAVGTLAGGIAHDFNNLLQIVLGHAELLMMDADKKAPGYQELHAIRSAAERGADLVHRILTFSRKVDANIRPVKLNEEVKQAERLLYRTIPKMIEIRTDLTDDQKVVNADTSQIEQMLVNLALNAKDAMPEGGTLVFETENVILDEEFCKPHVELQPGEYVRLTVSDTGHGMEEEVVEHVFEPFFTTKRPDKGTGLGLSMVFGIMKMHSGHITCESEPEKGTTFRIYLPVAEVKIASEDAPELPIPAGGTETILVVDDEELIAELAKKILSRSGYNVLTACSGREALEVYKRERANISLVILDLIMPEMGGKQCLEKLLKINPQVKALIASGFATDGEAKRFLEAAAKGTVSKPFNTRELLQSIRNVLEGA